MSGSTFHGHPRRQFRRHLANVVAESNLDMAIHVPDHVGSTTIQNTVITLELAPPEMTNLELLAYSEWSRGHAA